MSELYWFNGQPFAGIEPDAPAPVTPNTELYWVDGQPANDLLLLADTIPYYPPYVPPAPSPSPWGSEFYWVSGYPSQGLVDDPEIVNTSTEAFWVSGFPAIDTFPTVDTIPYYPPYVPPAPSPSPWGSEFYWVNGYPSQGLVDDPEIVNTSTETFWVDGSPDVDTFPTVDVNPYYPPYTPPPAYPSFYGNETFWVSGYPAEGIKTTSLLTTGAESYWVDGASEEYLFKIDNSITGRMFLIFE